MSIMNQFVDAHSLLLLGLICVTYPISDKHILLIYYFVVYTGWSVTTSTIETEIIKDLQKSKEELKSSSNNSNEDDKDESNESDFEDHKDQLEVQSRETTTNQVF
jgi:hypothetical protein